MPQRELTYQQDKFIFAEDHYVCIKGTFGCGKSLAGLIAANMECEMYPNNLFLIIRKEYVDLRDSTMKDWDGEFGDRYPIVANDVRYPNGSVLMFRHGDDLNALKNANLGGALMVQGEEMTEDDFWFLTGRLRRKEGSRRLRVECNYDGKNWIYKQFNQAKIGTLITTNTFDNEKNLPSDYIPNLKKLPKRLQERHLYGTDADMEGLVWEDFSAGRHLVSPFDIPSGWDRIVVLDHGMTNPTAVLWGAIDFDGNIFIYDEHYEAGQIVSYHANAIKSRDNKSVKEWLIDPSCQAKNREKNGQQYSVIEEYRDNGIFFIPANNEVLGGINRVSEYFKSDRLKIFKSCTHLIEEVGQYKWQKLKPGVQKNAPESPVKHNDHACFSYETEVLMADGTSKQIGEVSVGDSVMTPIGSQPVIWSGITSLRSEIVSVIIGNQLMEVTNDHEFAVESAGVSREDVLPLRKVFFQREGFWGKKLSSQDGLGTSQRVNSKRLSRPSQERKQDGQFFGESGIDGTIQAFESSHDDGKEKRSEPGEYQESYIGCSYMAQIGSGEGLAFDSLKGNNSSIAIQEIQLRYVRKTVRESYNSKTSTSFLRVKLQDDSIQKNSSKLPTEILQEKPKVISSRKAPVYCIQVPCGWFLLKNGLIAKNCDCLRYLISSRPESPIEKKVISYDAHSEKVFNPFVSTDEPTIEYDFLGEVSN